MFKNTYQNGLLSIFYSCGSNPLAIWDMEVNNGHIKRLTDTEVNSIVLEIVSTNVATTYISCPRGNQVLGIKLPFLVMIVKNLKRYFSFEITILDDKNMRRRFRISNFQSTTKIKPFCTTMPIGLAGGWNQIQFNLSDFTRRAYGSQFLETLRVQIHANVRLRRIYFSERLYTEEELPQDYKLYLPLDHKHKKGKADKKEAAAAPAAPAPATPIPATPAAEEAPPDKAPPPPPEAPPEAAPPPEATPAPSEPEAQGPQEAQEGDEAKESEATATLASTEAGDEKPPDMESEPPESPAPESEAPAEGNALPEEGEPPAEQPAEEGAEAPAEAPAEEAAEAPPE
ncbi:cilia- and flagella-associated protein 20-like [Plodia interpunctella]|uniref:cilia- and flagella-associated protein 20-like n=1 Tax=Plodia interpunctella TaxID=58824 RepID=UPI00236775D8|nr:cilia- and flagella-associated protein 20-like [Plodia interpunctella]